MSSENQRQIPIWVWVAVAVVAIGAAAWLASTGRRPDPPQAFRYDVSEFEKVDPALVIASELDPIELDVPGLRALATTPDGRIYAAGEDVLVVCELDGAEIARYSLAETPECLSVAPDGTIFLGMLTHVAIVEADGTPGSVWPPLDGQPHITALAADAENLYIGDAGNRVVWRFDHDGNLLNRIGERDDARDVPGLLAPSPCLDIAFDDEGAFWTVNPGRHGLEKYRPNGDLVTAWYRPSMELDGFSGCCNPRHVAFRSDGTLVTAEKGLIRVKLYSADWRLMGVVAPPQAFRAAPTGPFSPELESPIFDLAVDAHDRVLVLDANRNAIRVFAIEEND